jgi:hypothetical protein
MKGMGKETREKEPGAWKGSSFSFPCCENPNDTGVEQGFQRKATKGSGKGMEAKEYGKTDLEARTDSSFPSFPWCENPNDTGGEEGFEQR